MAGYLGFWGPPADGLSAAFLPQFHSEIGQSPYIAGKTGRLSSINGIELENGEWHANSGSRWKKADRPARVGAGRDAVGLHGADR